MLTSDGNLRKAAKQEGTDVKGIFFVFDQLIEHQIITHNIAIEKIQQLRTINSRLPQAEIEARIKQWT